MTWPLTLTQNLDHCVVWKKNIGKSLKDGTETCWWRFYWCYCSLPTIQTIHLLIIVSRFYPNFVMSKEIVWHLNVTFLMTDFSQWTKESNLLSVITYKLQTYFYFLVYISMNLYYIVHHIVYCLLCSTASPSRRG